MTDHYNVSVIGPGAGEGTLTGQLEGTGFEVYDTEFEAVVGDDARLELVAETDAHEGPVYIPGHDALYFTTLPRPGSIPAPGTPQAVIKRLALNGRSFPVDERRLSALPADVHMPNGMTLGHDGHLVVCEQGTRSERARISRIDPADWPFLADTDLEVQRAFEIEEYTDPHHHATVPHTLVVAPGLIVDKVYVGYWFWGRPTPFQLWEDLQDLHRRIKADFDPTTEQARAAWMAASVPEPAQG